jgi:hypothetical protein
VAESHGMTSCALQVPGFITLRETYGFYDVDVQVCFDDVKPSALENNTFALLCDPGQSFPWYVVKSFVIEFFRNTFFLESASYSKLVFHDIFVQGPVHVT